ncbi:MAG TPA: hypothetical protein VK436_01775 [Methanocella sp.]|nr:hypothetical protein [Methanocella sp.]
MIDIKNMDRQRIELLSIIYEVAGGSKRQGAKMKNIKDWAKIDNVLYVDIIDFWVDEDCITRKFEATDIEEYYLTHKGILKVEEGLRAKLVPKIKNL